MCAWLPALPPNASNACGVHPTPPHPHIVCTPLAWRAPHYLLPPRSRMCIVCGFTLYACPAHMCCLLPMVIPTYNQRPPMAATGPCGPCVSMPTWACYGECRDIRCTSSSSSTHIHDTLPRTHARTYGTTWRAVPLSCPSNMSTVRCAHHGKTPARAGMVTQRSLLSAKCPA
jgi:hypothetical protein